MSRFVYLLNAMEAAAQVENPAAQGYGEKRRAVLEHVEQLERELAAVTALKLPAGAQCKGCGFRYYEHNGHIIPCPRCTPLPAGTVAVPYAMVDDALTLLEGWIERYCKPRFKDEHLKNLEAKRIALRASPRAQEVA